MSTSLNSKIVSDGSEFIVYTKTTNLLLLRHSRSSVMPFRVKGFVATPGFQVRYNTTDPLILTEWHEMLCSLIADGLFEFLAESAHVGYFPYPESKEHLKQYVKGFI